MYELIDVLFTLALLNLWGRAEARGALGPNREAKTSHVADDATGGIPLLSVFLRETSGIQSVLLSAEEHFD